MYITTRCMMTSNVTIVEATYTMPDGTNIHATGDARRNPIDKNDADLAYTLAHSRALANLSRKVARQVNVMLNENDQARLGKLLPKASEDEIRSRIAASRERHGTTGDAAMTPAPIKAAKGKKKAKAVAEMEPMSVNISRI